MGHIDRTLEGQREEFIEREFLATPLVGILIWLIIGLAGLILPIKAAVWTLFIGTSSTVYLGLFISKFTGYSLSAQPCHFVDNGLR